jgi:hypothetical protein
MQERIKVNHKRRSQEYQSRERVRTFKAGMADGNGTAGSQDHGNPDDHAHTEVPAKKLQPLEMDETGCWTAAEVDDRLTQWAMETVQDGQQASGPELAESMSLLITWEESTKMSSRSAEGEEENPDDPDEDGSEFYAITTRQIPTAKRRSCKHRTMPGSEYTGIPASLYHLPPPPGRYESQTEREPDRACVCSQTKDSAAGHRVGRLKLGHLSAIKPGQSNARITRHLA